MKLTPIIISGALIPATLDGRKTMTRRVITPQPSRSITDWTQDAEVGEKVMYRGWPTKLTESRGRNKAAAGELTPVKIKCPYGKQGDRLWVRETLVIENTSEYHGGHEVPKDGRPIKKIDEDRLSESDPYWLIPHYRATEPEPHIVPLEGDMDDDPTRWTSSRFMPRWASRILLEITNIRVERVQDITEEDAIAEGVYIGGPVYPPRLKFRDLWNFLNAKRGYGWDVNPWVCVIEFKKL